MRQGLPSFTAMVVAGARAVADVDPVAQRLVPGPMGVAFRALRGSRVARELSLGLVDHLEVRTRAIDEIVAGARSPQLVVLGAGLDARAFRMRALEGTTVFEVDHPTTQAFKRARSADLRLAARELRFVSVDFERDDLGELLCAAGHDRSARTTWIWEGVTPYLTPAAIEATLAIVGCRSATGSVLAMTYATPELGSLARRLRRLVLPALELLGEGLHGLVTTEQARGIVEAAGFTVRADASVAALAARYGRRRPRTVIAEHVLVAGRA